MKHLLMFTAAAVMCLGADLDRGRQLYLESDLDPAITELRQVVEKSGDNAEANALLGMALVERDKVSEAEPYIKRAMELDSGPKSKIAMARLLIAQKQYDQAENMLKDASGDELEYVRGLLHMGRERYSEAAQDLEAYLEKNPKSAYAHYHAGLAYNKLRRPDKMLDHFQHFVRMKPDAPEARKVRAVLRTGR